MNQKTLDAYILKYLEGQQAKNEEILDKLAIIYHSFTKHYEQMTNLLRQVMNKKMDEQQEIVRDIVKRQGKDEGKVKLYMADLSLKLKSKAVD